MHILRCSRKQLGERHTSLPVQESVALFADFCMLRADKQNREEHEQRNL